MEVNGGIAVLHDIIQSNYTLILFCLFLLVFCLVDLSFEVRVRNYFIFVVLLCLTLTLVDGIDFYIEKTSDSFSMVRTVTSALGYALRPLSIFAIICIFKRRNRARLREIALLLYMNAIVSIASIWTSWVFYFDEANQFHRGPIGAVPFLTSGVYLVIMAYISLRGYQKNGGGETILVFFIVAAAVVGTILESVWHYKFMLNAAMSCGVCAYYLYLHVQLYKRDSLTGLLNRRSFYLKLQELRNTEYMLIAVDVNNLKTVNDTEGHAQGDVCITTVVETVVNCLPRKCTMYRTGGDEFMVVCRNLNEADVAELVTRFQRELEKTDYSASFGWTKYQVGEKFDSVCNRADAMMYDNKRRFKQAAKQQH